MDREKLLVSNTENSSTSSTQTQRNTTTNALTPNKRIKTGLLVADPIPATIIAGSSERKTSMLVARVQDLH
ncbi:hypothetical protein ACFX2B_039383 [Malus domestica]